MNGLLYKDLLNLRSNFKYLAFMILVFSVVFIPLGNELPVLIILAMFGAMLPTKAITYDVSSRWDRYAATLPLTPRELVKSKYLLMLIAVLAGGAVALLISAVMVALMPETGVFLSKIGPVPLVALFVVFGLLLGSVMLPLALRFGAEKMQYIIMIIVLIPILMVIGLMYLLETVGVGIGTPSLALLIAAAAMMTVAAMWISYRISAGIYARKEL